MISKPKDQPFIGKQRTAHTETGAKNECLKPASFASSQANAEANPIIKFTMLTFIDTSKSS
jgi:hypothetical protein